MSNKSNRKVDVNSLSQTEIYNLIRSYDRKNNNEDCFQSQKAFLYSLLASFDTRRNAVDMRCSITLALGIGSLIAVLSQMKAGEFLYPTIFSMKVGILIIILLILISCIVCLSLISPITRTRKEKKMPSKSISWFYLIANMTINEYSKEIQNLDDKEMIQELSKQVVLISKLLKKRYNRLIVACNFLSIGLVCIAIYIVITILFIK
ncbi:MAG: DUF5706 domain-containing protein [Clostridia bacterium]|nr:DUF5706 domain-containing protein [Clostridia bacterium]